MTNQRREELFRACERQSTDQSVLADDGAMFWDIEPLTVGELRELLIDAAVDHQLQQVGDQVKDFAHNVGAFGGRHVQERIL